MAEADWTELLNSIGVGVVDRGVTTGQARPNGGGSFLYGFNSLSNTPGAIGLYTNQVNFAPMAKGGSVRGAIKRGTSGGNTNFSPFFFLGGQGNNISDNAYLLGLDDDDPHQIVLRKGAFSGGVPSASLGTSGILAKSNASYSINTWLHLRLDMIANANGDVLLQAFINDLLSNPVTSPVWVAVPGLEEFIDDAIAVNSGSQPYTSGYGGYGFQVADVTRRGYVDHLEIFRQL